MRLSLVGPVYPYRGGIAYYTARLASELAKSHQVQVISFSRQYPRWLYPGKTDRDPSEQPLIVDARYPLDPLYPWTWLNATREIANFAPQGVIFQWWTTFWSPAFSSMEYFLRREGIPVLVLVHNVLPHEDRFFDRMLARLCLSQAHHLIVFSDRECKRLKKLLPGAEVETSALPIRDNLPQPLPKAEAKQKLGLPAGVPLVLFFGIVRAYKGLKSLLEAMAILQCNKINAHLVVAGEFWEDEAVYREFIQALHLDATVHCENRYIPDEEIPIYFSAADVFAAPYTGGTQSGVIKIALSYGLPLVISESIVEESLTAAHGEGIYITQPGNSQDLAGAIQKAIALPHDFNLLKEHPELHRTDWHSLAQSIESAFQDLQS